jgi:protein subunit release factor A
MEEKLEGFVARYEELNAMLSRPEVINDQERYHQLMREHSELSKVVQTAQALKKLGEQVAETEALLAESSDEPEMEELAQVVKKPLYSPLNSSACIVATPRRTDGVPRFSIRVPPRWAGSRKSSGR